MVLADTLTCSPLSIIVAVGRIVLARFDGCLGAWGRSPFPVTFGVPIPVVHPAPLVVDGGVGSSP